MSTKVEADTRLLLNQLPRFDNPYNEKLLVAGGYAMGKLAVEVFEAIQHTLRTNDSIAFQKFYQAHPGYRGVQANDALLKAAAAACSQPTVENLLSEFERIADRLVTNSDYTEAFADFFRAHPQYATVQGNVNVLEGALARAGETPTCEALDNLVFPGSPWFCGDRLVLDPAFEAQQADAFEREKLIEQISQGRPTYTSRRPYDGKVVQWKTAELHEETTERLREIAAFLAQQRGELRMTKDELKAINKAADAERLRQMMDSYPRLPSSLFLGGVEQQIDASFLKQIASTDLEFFRKLVRDYGEKAVNARLRGEIK